MLKQLTLVILAGSLLPACVLDIGDSTTSVSDSSTSGATDGTTTDPTTGTSDPSDGTTTDAPTTDATTTDPSDGTTTAPTTDAPTTDGTTTDPTDGTTTDATTGQGGDYGKCGWFEADKYYACESDGAVASLEDPDMISPIACDPAVAEGEKCTEEEGPVKGVGCCTPEGTLFYCDSEGANVIVKQDCGV